MDRHDQLEIRSYDNVISNEIVENLFPMTWRAFQDYRLNAMKLSARDIDIITELNIGNYTAQDIKIGNWFGWFNIKKDGSLKLNRERTEFEAKAKQLGMKIWNETK